MASNGYKKLFTISKDTVNTIERLHKLALENKETEDFVSTVTDIKDVYKNILMESGLYFGNKNMTGSFFTLLKQGMLDKVMITVQLKTLLKDMVTALNTDIHVNFNNHILMADLSSVPTTTIDFTITPNASLLTIYDELDIWFDKYTVNEIISMLFALYSLTLEVKEDD